MSSAKRFLSDTAISFTLILIFIFIKWDCINVKGFERIEGFVLPFSIIVLFLSYPVGLFINACSHFSLSKVIKKLEKKEFENRKGTSYISHKFEIDKLSYINHEFEIDNSLLFFNIESFKDYYIVSNILRRMKFVFKKLDRDVDYIEGLNQYLRNMSFVIIMYNFYLTAGFFFFSVIDSMQVLNNDVAFTRIEDFLQVLNNDVAFTRIEDFLPIAQNCFSNGYILLLSWAISIMVCYVLLRLCARLDIYYGYFNIHMAYIFGNTLSRKKIEKSTPRDIAFQIIREFAEYSFPEAVKKIEVKNVTDSTQYH